MSEEFSEFRHFLRKMNPGWKAFVGWIVLLVLGYFEYWVDGWSWIWVIAGMAAIVEMAMNYHFYKEDRKMFKRFERRARATQLEFELKMKQFDEAKPEEVTK